MVDTFITGVLSFVFIVLGISPVAGSLILLFLCEDLSSTLWICSLFSMSGFIHCLKADSSTLITGDLSPLL